MISKGNARDFYANLKNEIFFLMRQFASKELGEKDVSNTDAIKYYTDKNPDIFIPEEQTITTNNGSIGYGIHNDKKMPKVGVKPDLQNQSYVQLGSICCGNSPWPQILCQKFCRYLR